MADFLDGDSSVIQRVLDHIDNNTTDLADEIWREPVANYTSPERYQAELTRVMRRTATPFCPSAAIPEPGCYVAREAAQTPLVAVRGQDGGEHVHQDENADHDSRLELHHVGEWVGTNPSARASSTKARKRASNTWRLWASA